MTTSLNRKYESITLHLDSAYFHTYNFNTWKTEAGESEFKANLLQRVWDHTELQFLTGISKNSKIKQKKYFFNLRKKKPLTIISDHSTRN